MTTENAQISDECSICLVSLTQPGLDVFTTACQHRFHFQCLAKNIQARNNECPLCRTQLESLVNILNATSTNNTNQQQNSILLPPIAVQTPIPVRNISSSTHTGLWQTMTKSFRNLFSRGGGRSNVQMMDDDDDDQVSSNVCTLGRQKKHSTMYSFIILHRIPIIFKKIALTRQLSNVLQNVSMQHD